VTFFVLATVTSAPPPVTASPLDLRTFWLESWDGATRVTIGGARHDGPVQLQVDAAGLEEPPVAVTVDSIPGVAGGVATHVQTLAREPLLPLLINTRDQAHQREVVQGLRDLVYPDPERLTPDGTFRLVCASPSGTRQVGLLYRSGLEGSGTELPWSVRYVLDCIAPQPFAEDRADLVREYELGSGADNFFAWDDEDEAAPNFEDLELAPDVILGEDMPLVIASAVAPYATIEVVGPTGPGVVIEADTGLYLSIPAGVPAESTLRIVTDPRRKSIRLDGEPAAGMLARGSRLRPLRFGQNLLSITAPGADEDTRLRILWRGKYGSLW
jgi:hypothetical protein